MAEGLPRLWHLEDPVGEVSEMKTSPLGMQIGQKEGASWCDWYYL